MKVLMRADTHYSIAVRDCDGCEEPKYTFSQVLAAVAVSMGSMIIGFSSAYTSTALGSMNPDPAAPNMTNISYRNNHTLEVSKEQETWIGSLMPLAALAGGVIGGPLVDYIGRRRTILMLAPPFFVGWIMIASASTVHLVLAGRAVCGLCVGVGSLAFPVYLGETIQPEVRGTLGLFPTAIGNIGVLISYAAGKYLNWSELAYLGAALPVPFFILMLMIPETPRWYISQGREEEARKALQWLRGKNTSIDSELRDIALCDAESKSDTSIGELFTMKYMKAIFIALGLMTFQQLSGINAVIFYTVKIFKMSGSLLDENLSTIIMGVVNFASTFVATAIIDKAGRKLLLYISSVTMTLTLVILGTFFYVQKNLNIDIIPTLGWLPLASLMIYLLGFSLAFGPIPWLMMGEILPAKIRGNAASICTAFNWLCTFTVTKTFQNIIDAIGPAGTFWLFAAICFVGLFFVIGFVPETRGKSLEQIENKMTGRGSIRSRRMSAIANIKPLPNGC